MPQGMDTPDYLLYKFRMIERVSTGEGYIEILFLNYFHYFINGIGTAGIEIPRGGVMAAGAGVSAAGNIYRSAKSGAIHCGAPDYIQDID